MSLARSSRHGHLWLPLLLTLPLLGSTVVGFMFKMDFRLPILYTLISERTFWSTRFVMLVVQSWEFTPLFALLFSLQLATIPSEIQAFIQVSGASLGEKIREIYWPYCSDLAALLSLFSLTEGLREYVKFDLLLRASKGTDTELLGTWLERFYFTSSSVDPRKATDETLSVCSVLVILSLLVGAVLVVLLRKCLTLLVALTAQIRITPTQPVPFESSIIGPLAAGMTLLPAVGLFPFLRLNPAVPWLNIIISVTVSLFAVGCVMLLAINFGIAARILLKEQLSGFTHRSLPVFLLLFSLRFIPPIGMVLCGFFWLGVLRQGSQLAVYAIWIAAQSIISFPVVATFVLFTHFRVHTNEILLHFLSKSRYAEISTISFLLRFKREYGLIGLFAFSLILTESIINGIMAFQVPSIAHELDLRISGRRGSFEEATMMIIITALPLACGIYLWARTLAPSRFRRGGS